MPKRLPKYIKNCIPNLCELVKDIVADCSEDFIEKSIVKTFAGWDDADCSWKFKAVGIFNRPIEIMLVIVSGKRDPIKFWMWYTDHKKKHYDDISNQTGEDLDEYEGFYREIDSPQEAVSIYLNNFKFKV